MLYPASTTMGGRILKYDTDTTAISVSGWGGITIYTDDKPGGLPAVRADDHDPAVPAPQPATFREVRNAASDESAHLEYARDVKVAFMADWAVLRSIQFLGPGIRDHHECRTRYRTIHCCP